MFVALLRSIAGEYTKVKGKTDFCERSVKQIKAIMELPQQRCVYIVNTVAELFTLANTDFKGNFPLFLHQNRLNFCYPFHVSVSCNQMLTMRQ